MRRRCGRCGHGHLFHGWFRMEERCPGCGYRFAREEGFAYGVWFLNFTVTEALVCLGVMAFALWRGATHSTMPLWPVLAATGAAAVLAPIVYYPFAKATWAAIDLAMRPLELVEEAEALLARQPAPTPGPGPGPGPPESNEPGRR